MADWGGSDSTSCHCEARSAVAIHVSVQAPMDCFVPRNDKAFRNDALSQARLSRAELGRDRF